MKRYFIIALLLLAIMLNKAIAQEINFGRYATEDIVLTNVSSNTSLTFGQILQNEGLIQIQLSDPGVVVFSIEAEIDKDVFVTITAPPDIQIDPTNTIPFTMRAAYANKGNNNIGQAKLISGNTARFPVLARGNRPPGPPPTPKHNGYTTPTATAYLYIYGDITVGDVAAGLYTGMIDISVSYE